MHSKMDKIWVMQRKKPLIVLFVKRNTDSKYTNLNEAMFDESAALLMLWGIVADLGLST